MNDYKVKSMKLKLLCVCLLVQVGLPWTTSLGVCYAQSDVLGG
jgi:hypothetical protein